MEKEYSALHVHTDHSNGALKFADSTIKTPDLFDNAKELGLHAVAITEHEFLGGHRKALLESQRTGVKCILGNEIYLQSDEQYDIDKEQYISGQTHYPHFILLALDEVGYGQLRELSCIACRDNAYVAKMNRRVTKYSDIEKVIGDNKGHIHCNSACIGSFIGRNVLAIIKHKEQGNEETVANLKKDVNLFIEWVCKTFGKENFCIEIQPNIDDTEQWHYNKLAIQLANAHGLKYVVTTDAHYLSKDRSKIHAVFLNSKHSDDREVDSFYRTAYLMGYDELYEYLVPNIGEEATKLALENTNYVANKVKEISLDKVPEIPQIDPPEFVLEHKLKDYYSTCKYLNKYAYSDEIQDRYMVYCIENSVQEIWEADHKNLPTIQIDKVTGEEIVLRSSYTMKEMIERVDIELKELDGLSNYFQQPMGCYYLTFGVMIDKAWDEAETLVGAGRGSTGALLIAYLLGITQTNPLWWADLCPHWRHISVERAANSIMDKLLSRKLPLKVA